MGRRGLPYQIDDHPEQPQHHGGNTRGGGEGGQQGAGPLTGGELVETGGGELRGIVQKVGLSAAA